MSCVILLVQFEGLQPKKKPNPKPCNTKNWRLNRARLQVRAVILPRHFWGDQARGPALLTAISLLRDSSVPQGRATGGGRRRGQTGTLGAERQTGTLGADRQGPSGQMSLYACWRWGGGRVSSASTPFPPAEGVCGGQAGPPHTRYFGDWRQRRGSPHAGGPSGLPRRGHLRRSAWGGERWGGWGGGGHGSPPPPVRAEAPGAARAEGRDPPAAAPPAPGEWGKEGGKEGGQGRQRRRAACGETREGPSGGQAERWGNARVPAGFPSPRQRPFGSGTPSSGIAGCRSGRSESPGAVGEESRRRGLGVLLGTWGPPSRRVPGVRRDRG